MKPTIFALGLCTLMALTGTSGVRAADLAETDLAALRYFLSIDDQASVAAEIERLQVEFPGADVGATLALIDATAAQVDTSPIWRHIETKSYADARGEIVRVREANPDWSPPADMMEILDTNEGQEKFDAAFAARNRADAIAALAAFPVILNCDRINNAWRLAELQIADALKDDAIATYDGVLQSCRQEDYVVATLQKLNEIADKEQLAAFFTVARTGNPGLAEQLTAVETELGAGVAATTAATTTAAAAPAPAAPRASSGGGSSQGSGQLSRAQAAADRGDWGACLELTTGASSMEALNQRAWCAYNHGRAREAVDAFRRVAESGSGSMSRDATFGLILAYARLGQLEQAASVASRAQLTAEQRRTVNQVVISKLATSSFEAKNYRKTLDYLDRLSRDTGSLDRGLAMLRGWALLKSGKKGSAREQFSRVHAASPGKDSLQGLVESR